MVGDSDVLVVVDVQNGFVPGGNLPVPDGGEIVPLINRLARGFANVVLTQDWHPPGHISFATSHPGRKPFEAIELPYGRQVLWPEHCVQGTHDADLVPDLAVPHAVLIIRKGYRRTVDSYSAFNEADGTPTGLAGYLRERSIGRVFLAGLATDYCVGFSALDACRAGFATLMIEDACRGVDVDGSLEAAWARMMAAGVQRIRSDALHAP